MKNEKICNRITGVTKGQLGQVFMTTAPITGATKGQLGQVFMTTAPIWSNTRDWKMKFKYCPHCGKELK